MGKIPVYVISRERAHERRRQISAHLDELKIDYEIVDAVEGLALSRDDRAKFNPAQNLLPGSIGCYLSHLQMYERIVAGRIPVALILEDDAVLTSQVRTLVEHGCENLDFDFCFLGTHDQGDQGFVFYDADSGVGLGNGLAGYVLSSGPYCHHAYLVTLAGAQKRLECALPTRTPIDHYRFLPYRPRFRAVIPMIAFLNEQHAVASVSSVGWSAAQKWLYRFEWFYPLRDLLKLTAFYKWLSRRTQEFPYASRWRSFSSGMRVVKGERG
jgi:glycosyl transferase, family 25